MPTEKCSLCGKKVILRTRLIPYLKDNSKKVEYQFFQCCGYYRQKEFLPDLKIKKLYGTEYDDFNLNSLMTTIKDIVVNKKVGKLSNFITRKKILEVGSGAGSFLKQVLKRTPEKVSGIEISTAGYKLAKLSLPSANLQNVSFEDYKTRSKFDTIFMFHVIEHFKSPLAAVKKAYKLLERRGVLIMETPSWDSWEQEKFKENWYGWQVPFHTFLFSPKSLRRLVKKAGFKVKKLEHSPVPNSWVGSLKKDYPFVVRLGPFIILFYALFYLPALIAAGQSKGGRIIIYAEK